MMLLESMLWQKISEVVLVGIRVRVHGLDHKIVMLGEELSRYNSATLKSWE